MNREYILNRIKPVLNTYGMLNENDFNNMFGKFSKKIQYEIINILIDLNIDIDYENRTSSKSNMLIYEDYEIKKLKNEQLCVLYQKNNNIALNILIEKNEKLIWSRVFKITKIFKHKLENEDLFQYGVMGIIEAAKRFDIEKENCFTTYAIYWIDQAIRRSIANFGFTIRIPVHCFDEIWKLNRIISKNYDLSREEIIKKAEFENISREKFEYLLKIDSNIVSISSLNIFIGEQEDSEIIEFKIDDEIETVEEVVESRILKSTLESLLDTLTVKEKNVIKERFGMKDGIEKTLEQIGEIYGLTRERIRQIESKALEKLRHSSRIKKIEGFL